MNEQQVIKIINSLIDDMKSMMLVDQKQTDYPYVVTLNWKQLSDAGGSCYTWLWSEVGTLGSDWNTMTHKDGLDFYFNDSSLAMAFKLKWN